MRRTKSKDLTKPVEIKSGADACHWLIYFVNKFRLLPGLKSGFIPCVDCGESARYWEHRDYNKPLYVIPVCKFCNFKRGKAIEATVESRKVTEKAVRAFETAHHAMGYLKKRAPVRMSNETKKNLIKLLKTIGMEINIKI